MKLLTRRVQGSFQYNMKRQKGFSLLELLVVLVMLGFMAAVAGPATGRFLDTLDFKKQTGKVMSVIRYARLMAVTQGEVLQIKVSEETNSLILSGAVSETRELGLEGDDLLELDPAEIYFYPEGYASPGSLSFTKGERSQKIIIDPLTALPLLDYSEDN